MTTTQIKRQNIPHPSKLTNCHPSEVFRPLLPWNSFAYSFFVCVCFLGPHPWHMEVPRLGVKLELQLPAYTTAHGNAGSLTHRTRSGIESTTSWIVVRFVSAAPQWEFPVLPVLECHRNETIQNMLFCVWLLVFNVEPKSVTPVVCGEVHSFPLLPPSPCLSVCLSICLSVCLSIYLFIYLSTYLPTNLPSYLVFYC